MKKLILLAALLFASPALAQVQLPTAVAPNGTVRSQPSAIIVPNNPAVPGGAGCTVGATGCALTVTGTITPGSPVAVPSTNASSTVTTGGTYQSVFTASTARKGCSVFNPLTAPGTLSVRVGGAAVYGLSPGAMFGCGAPGGTIISDLIEVTSATTGHAFTAIRQ
jgi:hypothetical protein